MSDEANQFSRRAILRGAGAALGLPFLEAMLPRGLATGTNAVSAAEAAARPPLRMGIFTVTGGTVTESWKPQAVGALPAKLPSILRPLEKHRDQLLVISGLGHDGRSEGLNAHEHCALLHLTGASKVTKVNGRPVAGVSVDQAAAAAVGEDTYLPSLEVGLTNGETRYSFRTADQPVPYEANPRLVFDRMFRGRKPVVPNWRRRAAAASGAPAGVKVVSDERSVVDIVLEESRSLRGRLGRTDQHRLDEYLHSVRQIEKRIDASEARLRQEILDAADPGPSRLNLPAGLPPEGTPTHKVTRLIYGDPEKHGEYIRLMSDLLVLAFQTDTTRVFTFACGDDGAYFPGVVTVGYERHCHTLEHQGNAGRVEDADPISREALRQIHVWYTQLFAEAVGKMAAIDEGGSSLLDNTMLLYTSYMADGGHGRRDYPVLLAGKAGGRLKTGRHVAFPDRTPVANLYVEMLARMGVRADGFGDSKTAKHQAFGGRLPGLS